MRIKSRGNEPVVDASAFVAPTAVLVGNVRVGADCRIMYGAVLDSEGSRVEVGSTTIINEHAVLRATAVGDAEHPVMVGDHVLVGPHASLLGCTVEPCSYVATGATVLQGATVRSGANVAVGAVVHANAVVPREFFVPPNTVAVGDPLEVFAPGDEGLAEAIKAAGFAASAFGVRTPFEDRINRYRASTEVRAEEFGAHLEDTVVDAER
ncbi:acyltransferase [Rubrobacter tropicus]|uniref:Acyltransferase n=1 Tax=Rubrobacter tropicus TaxID=2653851 RepID=A0A6G8QDL8_9ACTN|nr:acyltransferase [Rubrobacter tropicus]QIN84595.1 acyltransferase [Rubrobacter tropicus]